MVNQYKEMVVHLFLTWTQDTKEIGRKLPANRIWTCQYDVDIDYFVRHSSFTICYKGLIDLSIFVAFWGSISYDGKYFFVFSLNLNARVLFEDIDLS